MSIEDLHLRDEVDKRSDYFGSGNITPAEMEKYENIFDEPENTEGSWDYVDQKIKTGDVPPIPADLVDEQDVYDAGAADGCPVTDVLQYEYGMNPGVLINLYLSRNEMHRTIGGLLKEVGNTALLDLWKGEETRKPGEERLAYAVAGTPTAVVERGNPHIGVAKYENFAICQLFRRLKDAEYGANPQNDPEKYQQQENSAPVKGLPRNKKLYPNIDEFKDDAKDATSLNELNNKFVARLIPKMLEGGVTKDQTVALILDCFLAEPLLIEDNCWERAGNATRQLAESLIASDDPDKKEIGESLLSKIDSQIEHIKQLIE